MDDQTAFLILLTEVLQEIQDYLIQLNQVASNNNKINLVSIQQITSIIIRKIPKNYNPKLFLKIYNLNEEVHPISYLRQKIQQIINYTTFNKLPNVKNVLCRMIYIINNYIINFQSIGNHNLQQEWLINNDYNIDYIWKCRIVQKVYFKKGMAQGISFFSIFQYIEDHENYLINQLLERNKNVQNTICKYLKQIDLKSIGQKQKSCNMQIGIQNIQNIQNMDIKQITPQNKQKSNSDYRINESRSRFSSISMNCDRSKSRNMNKLDQYRQIRIKYEINNNKIEQGLICCSIQQFEFNNLQRYNEQIRQQIEQQEIRNIRYKNINYSQDRQQINQKIINLLVNQNKMNKTLVMNQHHLINHTLKFKNLKF